MQNFVLAGKAKTVFRLIELKAQREQAEKDAQAKARLLAKSSNDRSRKPDEHERSR